MKAISTLAFLLCATTITHFGRAADPVKLDLPETVATVDGTEIKNTEVEKALTTFEQRSGRKLAYFTPDEKQQAVRAVVDQLINEQLIKSRCSGVEITDADVEARFKQITSQTPDPKKFQEQLEAAHLTEAEFKDQIRERLRGEKWISNQLFGQGDATDADAKAYYDAHLAEFDLPELVRASNILVTVSAGAPDIAAGRLKVIEAAAERISKGEDFGKVAAEVSEDARTKDKGGDLGYFPKTAKPSEITDAAFALKDGEVSKVVVSLYGFNLIKRTGHKAARKISFEEAKALITARLTKKNQDELTRKLVEDIRSKADVKINLPAQAGDQR